MTTLTPELRQAIDQAGDQPVRLLDPETQKTYVLLSAETYERLRAVFDDSDFDVKETYPLVWQAMKEEWEDPSMDVYDTTQEKP
jgi:hypothetical protein